MVFWSEAWVRRVIKDFNRMGRDALYPNRAGGRPPTFTPPFDRSWSTSPLAPEGPRLCLRPVDPRTAAGTAVMLGIVESISKERLREILHEEAVTFQAVKTWKQSQRPQVPRQS